MNLIRCLKTFFYKRYKFSHRYSEGRETTVNYRRILIDKMSSGVITVGNYVICHAELYSFLGRGSIKIGDYSYIGVGSKLWALSLIEVGNRVLIGHNCFICDNTTHPENPIFRHQQFMAKFGAPSRKIKSTGRQCGDRG